MLRRMPKPGREELYAIYYVVYGSLAEDDRLVREHFWSGPYESIKQASQEAQKLRDSHQGDESFVIKRYRQHV